VKIDVAQSRTRLIDAVVSGHDGSALIAGLAA